MRPAVEENLRSALAKIGIDSPLPEALRESVADQQVLDPRVLPGAGGGPEILAVLAEAVASLAPVCFTYYSLSSGETRERSVEPYGIGYFKGRWYLVGRDVEKDEERVFRTSRIRGEVTRLPGGGYAIPPGFSLRARVGVAPWEMTAGPRVRARVRFDADVAWMIRENVRPGQTFSEEADGGGILEIDVSDEAALVRWVAEYGARAEVLAPPALRERMRKHFKEILEEGER